MRNSEKLLWIVERTVSVGLALSIFCCLGAPASALEQGGTGHSDAAQLPPSVDEAPTVSQLENEAAQLLKQRHCQQAVDLLHRAMPQDSRPRLRLWLGRAAHLCWSEEEAGEAYLGVLAAGDRIFTAAELAEATAAVATWKRSPPPRAAQRTAAPVRIHSEEERKKARDAGVTTLIAAGITAGIGAGLLVGGGLGLFAQNTFCDIGSTNGGRLTGCQNLFAGIDLVGFGATHLLVGTILFGVGAAEYQKSQH